MYSLNPFPVRLWLKGAKSVAMKKGVVVVVVGCYAPGGDGGGAVSSVL
jgi:hypothetical protein